MYLSDCRYLARHEIEFLRSLGDTDPIALEIICRQILADQRRWDPSVDVGAIKAEAERLLAEICGGANGDACI